MHKTISMIINRPSFLASISDMEVAKTDIRHFALETLDTCWHSGLYYDNFKRESKQDSVWFGFDFFLSLHFQKFRSC